MKESIIQFKNVSFSYDAESGEVLKNISLDLFAGEFVAILGHNGSGKSTLAKLTNALLVPTSGEVLVGGLSTAEEKNEIPIRQKVGMVFQNPDNQIVSTIVEDDVAFGPENLGVPPAQIRERVDDALKAVGMYEYRGHEPHRLSGGQKQRVAIAGVIAMRTQCIVLDEPTAMLDPKGRREVTEAVTRLNREYGITVVLVTHFMSEAVAAHRVIVMNDGEIFCDAAPAEVFSRGEELKKIGLGVPRSQRLNNALRESGLDLGTDTLTPESFADAFSTYINKKNNIRSNNGIT